MAGALGRDGDAGARTGLLSRPVLRRFGGDDRVAARKAGIAGARRAGFGDPLEARLACRMWRITGTGPVAVGIFGQVAGNGR